MLNLGRFGRLDMGGSSSLVHSRGKEIGVLYTVRLDKGLLTLDLGLSYVEAQTNTHVR